MLCYTLSVILLPAVGPKPQFKFIKRHVVPCRVFRVGVGWGVETSMVWALGRNVVEDEDGKFGRNQLRLVVLYTQYLLEYLSGQIIATSHDLTSNGGLVREISLFQGNLGW